MGGGEGGGDGGGGVSVKTPTCQDETEKRYLFNSDVSLMNNFPHA